MFFSLSLIVLNNKKLKNEACGLSSSIFKIKIDDVNVNLCV